MNTLMLLLLTAGVPSADPTPVVSSPSVGTYSAPVVQTQPTTISESGDSGWMSRWRSRPGLLSRVRGWFGRSDSVDQYHSSPMSAYQGSVITPSTTTEGRLVPTPVTSASTSSSPRITYTTSEPATTTSMEVSSPQKMPNGPSK
jgi:hypothetical protein